MLRRALTADTLIHEDEYRRLREQRVVLERIQSGCNQKSDFVERGHISPILRRKKSKHAAIERVVKQLEEFPKVRTPSLDDQLRNTVKQLQEYDHISPELVLRLERILPAERIGSPMHRAIVECLHACDASDLAAFNDDDWNEQLMAELLLDNGAPHPLSLHFVRQLLPIWLSDESEETLFRCGGPLPLLLKVWFTDDIRLSLPSGSSPQVAERLCRRILRHLSAKDDHLIPYLVEQMDGIDCGPEILVRGLMLRVYAPRFFEHGLDPSALRLMVSWANENFPCCPKTYASLYAKLDEMRSRQLEN